MSDRHLRRAKRKDNGEWETGYYFCMVHNDGRHIHHFIIPLGADLSKGRAIDDIQVEVDPYTICQCTGYKGIWENDIFQCDNERYMIVFSDAGLTWNAESIFSSESIELGEFCSSEIEVIGNVFDNLELLEVGE